MKKTLAILLALVFALSLSACKKADKTFSSNGSVPSSVVTDSIDFKMPQDYAVVLLASINPQVKLYLDNDGIVLALEAVNNDAKEIIDNIVYNGADYQTVIKLFISAANTKGFIKGDATVEFEIIEAKDTKINTQDILSNASATATKAADELEITLNVRVLGNIESENNDETYTSSDAESNNNKTESKPDTDKTNSDEHIHSYSKASCTKAATCSCGVTNGKALGHDWQGANCKVPKTCKTCGATEGKKGEHSYSDGKCSVCGATNALNPKTNLSDKEYVGNLKVSGDMLIGAALQFDSEACVVIDRQFNSVQSDPNQTSIVFEGKNYYSEGGGMNPHYYELTDTEIIVKGSFWGEAPDTVTMKLTLQSNGMLKVTYSTHSEYPVGTVLSTDINDVLK